MQAEGDWVLGVGCWVLAISIYLFDVKGRAVQMALAEGAADFQLFTDDERLLGAYYLQAPDASALATIQGDEINDGAEVILQFLTDEIGNLVHCIFHCPAIEVIRFLIIVVEHLLQHSLVVSIAEGVFHTDQIGLGRIFPTILELLRLSATTL